MLKFEECPYIVVYGNLSDGFHFYGPFEQQKDAEEFVDRLGLTRQFVEFKLLDIPTH